LPPTVHTAVAVSFADNPCCKFNQAKMWLQKGFPLKCQNGSAYTYSLGFPPTSLCIAKCVTKNNQVCSASQHYIKDGFHGMDCTHHWCAAGVAYCRSAYAATVVAYHCPSGS